MAKRDYTIKRCTKCGFTCDYARAALHFSREKRKVDGYRSECKNCERLYRSARSDEYRIQRQEYRLKNRDKARIRWHRYYKKHSDTPEFRIKQSVRNHQRRAQIRGLGGELSITDLELVLKAHTDRDNYLRCAFCHKPINGRYHLDHFIPLDKGGTNSPGNYRVMHPSCNLRKANKMPYEIGMLI